MQSEKQAQWGRGYCEAVGDLLTHEKVQQMRRYPHHKPVDTLYHSVYVSFLTYRICTAMHWRAREAPRAALLHDFYLYNWYVDKHEEGHAWYHPKEAVKNAEHYFGPLTPMQRDMILSHMWPLHLMPPRSREGMALTFADKVGAVRDFLRLSKRFEPVYTCIETEMKRYARPADPC